MTDQSAGDPAAIAAVSVPMVLELAAMGREYAYPTDWRKPDRKGDPPVPTRWRITDKGHAVLGQALRERARRAIERGAGEWVRPPSSGKRRDAS